MTGDEAKRLADDLEVYVVRGTPEGDVWHCVLRGPMTSANWPIDWFVNDGSGDVLLVVGSDGSEAGARAEAAVCISESAWRPGIGLREAERLLFPGASSIDEEAANPAERLRSARCRAAMDVGLHPGCSDRGCIVNPNRQGTNGRCKCAGRKPGDRAAAEALITEGAVAILQAEGA